MNDLYSDHYLVDYRGLVDNQNHIKILSNKTVLSVENIINFDIDSTINSSIDLFAGSLLSDTLLSILKYASKEDIFLDDLEGKIEIKIASPLAFLLVHGYEDTITKIDKITITFFMFTSLETDEQFERFIESALNQSILYNTLRINQIIEVRFKQIL